MKQRVLSLLPCLCMAVSLLPTAALAAESTITPTANTWEALTAAFNSAQNGDTVRLSEDITTGTELLQYITLSKSMTLDFAGFTIHYKATGTDINHINGLFHSSSGVTLTPKGTGGVTFAGNYSSLAQVNPGGKIIVGAVLIRMQPKPKAA